MVGFGFVAFGRRHRRTAALACLVATALAALGPAATSAGASSVIGASAPGAPQSPQLFAGGSRSLVATWNPPSGGSAGLLSYTIDLYDASGVQAGVFVRSFAAPGSATSKRLGGLQAGVAYDIRVTAQSNSGFGARSAPSNEATPEGPPDAPLDATLAGTAGDGLVVAWSPPPDNGRAVTRYLISLERTDGAQVATAVAAAPATSWQFGARTPGTSYVAQVRAVTALGASAPTADTNAVTVSSPGSPAPPAVTSPPPSTVSDYILAASSTPVAMTKLGCRQGDADGTTQQGRSSLALIDFGGQYGARSVLLIGTSDVELTYAQVVADTEAYVAGYRSCVAGGVGPLAVGITTNNSLNVSRALGRQWATDVVDPTAAWAARTYGSAVSIGASNDMEPGFGAPAPAKAWVAGYVDASAGNVFYNSGSADGCSGTVASDTCNDGWTVGTEYDVAAGASPALIRAVPQIYTPNGVMAQQWQGISNSGPAAGGPPVSFAAELTQQGSCTTPGSCQGTDNSPATGWDQLTAALDSSPITAQASLPWSTDIAYSPASAGASASPNHNQRSAAGGGACTAGDLGIAFLGHAEYGSRPLTYYPIELTNGGSGSCRVGAPSAVSVATRAGMAIPLTVTTRAGAPGVLLAPGQSATLAVGLPDRGTVCRYVGRFAVSIPGLGHDIVAPVTGVDGGAAVCGGSGAVLTPLRTR